MAPFDNNAYIVTAPGSTEAVVIDAPGEPAKLLVELGSLRVQAILITHGHHDHHLGLAQLRAATGAPVGIHPADAGSLDSPPDFLLADGDSFRVGAHTLRVLHTPGHTPGSVCLLVGQHLFSGDTLFPGGPGHTNTPEEFQQLEESITRRLLVLPEETAVYPGHGRDTTIGIALREYQAFASRPRPRDLCGDVTWLGT